MNQKMLLEYLETHVKPSRIAHTRAVAETAVALARLHGGDPEKAELAALLHDAAKYMPEAEAYMLCAQAAITIDDWTRKMPELLHAPAGAALAKIHFHVNDSDILHAVRYHTTGRVGMSLLEKIIYLADIIEPTRKAFDGLEEIRQTAKSNLDAAVCMAMDCAICYVIQKNGLLHPDTIVARNTLWDIVNNQSKSHI